MLSDWDLTLYQTTMPDKTVAGDADLRWAVRSNGDAGFIFVNNYQRLHALPAKNLTRFALTFPAKNNKTVYIPSMPSKVVTVEPATWFVWPVNQVVGSSAATSSVVLAWATAQLLCRLPIVGGGSTAATATAEELVVMAATQGIAPELAFLTSSGVSITGAAGTVTTVEGDNTVVRSITPGLGAAVTIKTSAGTVVQVVVLPTAMQDKVWKYAATTSKKS